jgi:oligoendopeptidase F
MDLTTRYPRTFLRRGEDMGDPRTIKKAYARLMAMPVSTKAEVERWCDAWGEVMSSVSEKVAKTYWRVTNDTNDKTAQAEYARLAERVVPLTEKLDDAAKHRMLEIQKAWIPKDMRVARERVKCVAEIYCKANLPLIARNIKLANKYDKIVSVWQTEFDGKKLTASQLRPYLETPDRKVREEAWRARAGMHAADRAKLDDLFDRMLEVRKRMAINAGTRDYVDYRYRQLKRISYDRGGAERFREAIKRHVVPAATKIMDRRRRKLLLKAMRPWDVQADPNGAKPPKVYKDVADLKNKGAKVLGAIDPEFAKAFRCMDRKGYLDLENRPGKAPGAYSNDYAEERMLVIFCNSVGTSDDFDTLVHEGGHAMHGFASRHLHYLARDIPLEFCEVASMALELLARPHWSFVYDERERERIGRKQLEDALLFLPFMAMLDEFQAWVYIDPGGESASGRARKWRDLEAKYRPYLDWEGLESEQEMGWQYNHVYTVPLYYIEYGIAQVGALQLFLNSLSDYGTAVKAYKRALSLGCTVNLPELYATAGVGFVVKNPSILQDVVDGIMEQVGLSQYPA